MNERLPDTKIILAYITNVNRVFSDNALATSGAAAGNFKMKSPIINVSYKGLGLGEIVGYGYFLDFDTPAANYVNSNRTYGLRLKGNKALGGNTLLYTAEYASQSNYKNNPVIDLQKKDFRDPNVTWNEQIKKWLKTSHFLFNNMTTTIKGCSKGGS